MCRQVNPFVWHVFFVAALGYIRCNKIADYNNHHWSGGVKASILDFDFGIGSFNLAIRVRIPAGPKYLVFFSFFRCLTTRQLNFFIARFAYYLDVPFFIL